MKALEDGLLDGEKKGLLNGEKNCLSIEFRHVENCRGKQNLCKMNNNQNTEPKPSSMPRNLISREFREQMGKGNLVL